jgi:transposase
MEIRRKYREAEEMEGLNNAVDSLSDFVLANQETMQKDQYEKLEAIFLEILKQSQKADDVKQSLIDENNQLQQELDELKGSNWNDPEIRRGVLRAAYSAL